MLYLGEAAYPQHFNALPNLGCDMAGYETLDVMKKTRLDGRCITPPARRVQGMITEIRQPARAEDYAEDYAEEVRMPQATRQQQPEQATAAEQAARLKDLLDFDKGQRILEAMREQQREQIVAAACVKDRMKAIRRSRD